MNGESHSLPSDDGTGSRQSMHEHLLWILNSLPLEMSYEVIIRPKNSAKIVKLIAGQSEASLGNGQTLSINPAPKSPVVATVERV